MSATHILKHRPGHHHHGHITRRAGRLSRLHTGHVEPRRDAHRNFDWAAQIRLALVLSVVAALATSALAGRVADSVLVVGVIVVASVFGWSRVTPVAQPARVRAHRSR